MASSVSIRLPLAYLKHPVFAVSTSTGITMGFPDAFAMIG